MMKKVAEKFGGFNYFSYLCNVIREMIARREAATRCSWLQQMSNTIKNIYKYGIESESSGEAFEILQTK